MNETNRAAATCAYHYTVKRGDSYYLIARRLGVPLRDLMNANPGISPTQLMVGDVLCVPYCAGGTETQPETPEVNVPDTNVPDTGVPDTGVPDTSLPDANTPVTPIAPPPPETPPAYDPGMTCPADRQAVVAEGQTTADVQIAYNKSYRTLQAANPAVDIDNLQAGQTLCIPEINIVCSLPSSITLGENESLASVAVRYNLPIAAVLRANPCLAPDDFMQGVTIKLPQ